MPTFNITLNKDADSQHIEDAKKKVTDQGGKIVHEFKIIPGFTAELPEDQVSALETNEHITVEADGKVSTQ